MLGLSKFLTVGFNSLASKTGPVEPAARLPALLLVDVQREFCDPNGSRGNKQTRAISNKIAAIAPEFRKAGLPFYPIYFTDSRNEPVDEIDFYKFKPETQDTIIQKNTDSAFASTDIAKVLEKDGRETLLVCGFNLNACVHDTVMDAAKNGFKVKLIRDLTGNDNWNSHADVERRLSKMADAGVEITDSRTVLAQLRPMNMGVAA